MFLNVYWWFSRATLKRRKQDVQLPHSFTLGSKNPCRPGRCVWTTARFTVVKELSRKKHVHNVVKVLTSPLSVGSGFQLHHLACSSTRTALVQGSSPFPFFDQDTEKVVVKIHMAMFCGNHVQTSRLFWRWCPLIRHSCLSLGSMKLAPKQTNRHV